MWEIVPSFVWNSSSSVISRSDFRSLGIVPLDTAVRSSYRSIFPQEGLSSKICTMLFDLLLKILAFGAVPSISIEHTHMAATALG
jgi:hypothetical protein